MVVAAYQIAVADRALVSACETCHHLVADRRLVQTEWRRAQIHDDLRALLHQAAHRFEIVERSRQIVFGPNVLANRYADFFPVNKKGLDALSRLKIALFVKNIVSRQKGFVGFANWFAAFEQSRGVTKRFAAPFVAINEPDEQRRIADASV